jgi:hypothetical protein
MLFKLFKNPIKANKKIKQLNLRIDTFEQQ